MFCYFGLFTIIFFKKPQNIFKIVIFYLAETRNPNIKVSHEHQGFVWENYETALRRVTFDNAKRVLRETEEYLRQEELR